MAAKTESYFSAQLDPELLELIEKFSIDSSELNTPDQSESKKTDILAKESSDSFHEQLNILYEEDLCTEYKILNINDEINSVKTIKENSETQCHTEKNLCYIKKEAEENESCSQLENLGSSNKNPKELIDPNFDEKILEDLKNLIIIEENSDPEEEKDIGEIKERGPDKQPRQNVRFDPILRNNWEIRNNVNAHEPPLDYTSSITNNIHFPETNNIIDPSFTINNDHFLNISNRNLDSSSMSKNTQFSKFDNIGIDSSWMSDVQFSESQSIGFDSSCTSHVQFSESQSIGFDSPCTSHVQFSESQSIGFDSPCTSRVQFSETQSVGFDSPCASNAKFSELHDVDFDSPSRSDAQSSATEIAGHCSLYVTHNNIHFAEINKLVSASSSFDQNPHYFEPGKINTFDDVEIVQNMKNLPSQTDLRHIDCNTIELKKDILQEDLQSKFLSVDEVEHVFQNLSNTDSKTFSEKKSDFIHPQEQLLSLKIGKIKLNSLPELNQNCLFNTYGKNSNLDQIRLNHARENYVPNFTSTSNKEDNPSCVNKDKENIFFNNANYFLDKTDKNVNSSSNISNSTQNCKNLSPVVTSSSALSSTHELSEYDKTSLEIESKIRQLCTKRYLKEKPVSLRKNVPKYKQSVSSNMSASVSYNHAQNSNRDSERFEYRRVSCMLDTTAATKLLSSPSFDHDKQKFEESIINQDIQRGLYGTEDKKVIHLLKRSRKNGKNKKTNLHEAVLNSNVEKAYSIVEIQKKHHGSVEGINIRDSLNNRTALDYANLKGMDLLADYLRENLGHESVIVEPHSPLSTIGV
ncbi:uncharacterized protein TNCT_169361 [Trichonephila clavata]|uniref:Uncharacterized protein n=1 Tax=Trichonephila clavata TaxID=2740835 RepID=A0A8X6H558_TRICU|nr:uncharacterized protein TNCT_169361 [Trichonephila clavata]